MEVQQKMISLLDIDISKKVVQQKISKLKKDKTPCWSRFSSPLYIKKKEFGNSKTTEHYYRSLDKKNYHNRGKLLMLPLFTKKVQRRLLEIIDQ